MEFIERYDVIKCQYLVSLGFKHMKPYIGQTAKNDEERRIIYNKIQRFAKGVVDARGYMIRQYHYSLSTPLEMGGRLFSGLSIQGLPKKIRGFLVREHTVDIDMVNAHPTILSYLCKKHNIHSAELNNYITNREKILSLFSDREKAKTQFLISVNTDVEVKTQSPVLRKFDKEMKEIQSQLIRMSEYKDIVSSIPDDKYDNRNGSAINRILCMYENKIIQVALSVLNKHKVEVFAPMFDGIMCYSENWRPEFLTDIYDAVEHEFNGLGCKWSVKEHDNDIQIPDGWTAPAVTKPDGVIVSSDMEAANIIWQQVNKCLVYSDGNYFYKYRNLWISNLTEIASHLRLIVLKSKIYRADKDGEHVPYAQNLRNAEAITKCVLSLAMEERDDMWIQRVFDSSHGYLLFTNGYWDFKKAKFYSNGCEGFDYDIVFTVHIPFDYDVDYDDSEMIERVDDILFKKPFGDDVGDYYKLMLARGLAGDCMKKFLVGIGPSNSGKSLISLCLKMACGGYYDGWNGANVALKNNVSDEAQRLRWLFLLRDKRIIVSNELSTNIQIDGNMLKKMSNGGKDDITGRLHGGNETKFRIGFLPILFAQDLPEIKPYDDAVETRLRSIPYTKIYVDEPSNDLELKKDPGLEAEVCTDRFRQGFLRLLFNSYHTFHINGRHDVEVEAVRSSTKAVVGVEANVIETWLSTFEITDNQDDYVLSSDIQQWLLNEKLGVTITKFGLELNRYCHINKRNVTSKQKKIHGKGCKVWLGCRMIPDEPDELAI